MILLRVRPHRFLASGLLPLCLLSLALLFAYGPARAAGSSQPKPAGPNNRLRELMTQRYEMLQRAVKDSELLLGAGRVDVPTHQSLTVALYQAQADLCTTAADRVKVQEKLVEVLVSQEKLLERQADAGRASAAQVVQGKLVTLNAQIDLERLRLGQPASQ